jgi:mono/diheme cytochrome c family protein
MWLRRCVVGGGLIVSVSTVAWGGRPDQSDPPREDPNSGTQLYRTYCASCHGPNGGGDGPAASVLRTALPDLRTISVRHGGTFPSERVTRIIDGRDPLPDHTRNEMPRWGAVLRTMEMENERAVRLRVQALIAHLESIQVR